MARSHRLLHRGVEGGIVKDRDWADWGPRARRRVSGHLIVAVNLDDETTDSVNKRR